MRDINCTCESNSRKYCPVHRTESDVPASTTNCLRCNAPAKSKASTDSSSRPFRKALKGYCAACVVVRFFRGDVDTGIGFALPPDFDPQGLLLPHIQRQFERVLAVGNSELLASEIDWHEVIRKWAL
jgi:hypothetical protein